ncbi:MAG: hypothetical protein E7350_00015 [Clostridiales bacterium]|nr:hypothetical protein [Clostridiales bacterium]
MDEKLQKIKNTEQYRKVTKKTDTYVRFLRTRVAPHIASELGEEMVQFAMGRRVFSSVLKKLRREYFTGKVPSSNPELHLVIAQSGGGKSELRKMLLEGKDMLSFNTDDFKRRHPLCNALLAAEPTLFGALTGLDSYLLCERLFDEAIQKGFSALTEITPLPNDLLGINVADIQSKGYKVTAHVLAVGEVNSLLAIHERYEQALALGAPCPKLTDLIRALDSVKATELALKQLIREGVEVKLYARQGNTVIHVPCKNEDTYARFLELRQQDRAQALPTMEYRIAALRQKMKERNAPNEQACQLEKIYKLLLEQK